MMVRHFDEPAISTIDATSLDETIAKVIAAGGALAHGPNEIPGIGNTPVARTLKGICPALSKEDQADP